MLYLLSYNSEVTTHALGVLSSYVKEFYFSVIFLAEKFVLLMIIRILAATESATLPI